MEALEQFHYGHLIHHGEHTGDARVLGRSGGVTDNMVEFAVAAASFPPVPDVNGVGWGIVRAGRGRPMVLGRAEQPDYPNPPLRQFIFVPANLYRELAGNIRAWLPLVSQPLPIYEMLSDGLDPVMLPDVNPPTREQAIDDLLFVFDAVKSNTNTIQPLVGAIVSGTPLLIKNAPKDAAVRAQFVQGLLALLPSSTRFGVTFALNHAADSGASVQIAFDDQVQGHGTQTVFDYQSGKISGMEVTNEYSKFVISQMRLDIELAIQATENLTPMAGWRFNNGASLAEALDYASYRVRMDQSIRNNLPVEASNVAKILAQDPTLEDDLRMKYARHLIRMSLAVDELEHVEAVSATMHNNPELEDEVYMQMAEAMADGKGALIFDTLVTWKENPFSPNGPKWTQLMQTAALSMLEEKVADQDTVGISAFLDDLQTLGQDVKQMVPRVLNRVLPLADRNEEIPPKLLLLAFQNFEDEQLNQLLKSSRFVKPLPRPVKVFLALIADPARAAPDDVIMEAVESVPEAARNAALMQFARMAFLNKRIDLIDTTVLGGMVNAMMQNPNTIDHTLVSSIALAINESRVTRLERPAPRYILQLLLETRRYEMLAKTLTTQARDVYGIDGQDDYVTSIAEMFSKSRLSPQEAAEALEMLVKNGVRDVAEVAAICGALEGTGWSAEMQRYANKAMVDLASHSAFLELIPPGILLNLLRYQVREGTERTQRVAARLVGSCNAQEPGRLGLRATNVAYRILETDEVTKPFALEVVRQYVREASEKPARHIIKVYGDKFGPEVRGKLQLSYEFSNFLARLDWLTYAESLQLAVDLLQNIAETFHSRNRPGLADLRMMIENFRSATELSDHKELARQMRRIAHSIVLLGDRQDKRSSNNERWIEQVVAGQSDPKSVLDVFRSAGGYLLAGRRHPFRLKDHSAAMPFGELDGPEIPIHAEIVANLLEEAISARADTRNQWSYVAVVDEIESLSGALLGDHRVALRQMGRNWQRLSDLVYHIANEGNKNIIEPDNRQGRRLDNHETEPQSALEFFRFVYGYFSD